MRKREVTRIMFTATSKFSMGFPNIWNSLHFAQDHAAWKTYMIPFLLMLVQFLLRLSTKESIC